MLINYYSRDEDKDKITCLAVEVDNPDCFTAIVGKWIVQNIGNRTERTQNI